MRRMRPRPSPVDSSTGCSRRCSSIPGGYDVCSPWRQQCCGAIAHHNGDWDTARKFARKNIDRFLPENGIDLKFITCNIAGCGSMLREYEHLLRDDAKYLTRAREFSKR